MTKAGNSGIYFKVFSKDPATIVPLFTPAKFSVVVGGGPESSAPLPFCADGTCSDEFAQYTITGENVLTYSSPPLYKTYDDFNKSGKLPLAEVIACSSAVEGTKIMYPKKASGKLKSAVWIQDTHSTANSFVEFQARLASEVQTAGPFNQTLLHTIAESGVSVIIDGAYTDNTGIAQAISAGATTVTSMVNNIGDVWKLFVDEPGPISISDGRIWFQIFDKSPAIAMQDFTNTSTCLQTDSMTFLRSLCFGTVRSRTVSNSWMGVEANVDITLNIIAVSETPRVGMWAKGTAFAHLVQEIAMSVADQSDARVVPLLHQFFLHS